MKVKWVGHSSQSDGHYVYWPHKVSVERNLIFNEGDKSKLSPILPYEESTDGTSRKLSIAPSFAPSFAPQIPSSPTCSSLSQLSGEGQTQEINDSSHKQDLLDLQLSQEPTSGPSEQVPSRRIERIHLQQEKNLQSGLVTRSQTRRDTGNDTSTLVYEIDKDNHLEDSEINPGQDNQEFDLNYLTISAEPVEENEIDIAFSTQTLIIPNSTNEAPKDPIWKESMNDEYKALIN